MQSSSQTTNDSLIWLTSQTPEIVSLCLLQIVGSDNPAVDLANVVSQQRLQHLHARITPVDSIVSRSPWIPTPLAAQLALANPSTYPWLSVEESLGWYAASSDSESKPRANLNQVSEDLSLMLSTGFDVHSWTSVSMPKELSAALLGLYLRVEHPLYGFFDADLLVRDLARPPIQPSSSLLLTAILLWTSVSCPCCRR